MMMNYPWRFMIRKLAILINGWSALLVIAKNIVGLAGCVVNIGVVPVTNDDNGYVFIRQFSKGRISTVPATVVINHFLTIFQH